MTQRALVTSDVITNLFATQAELDAAMHPSIAATAVTVPNSARIGYRLVGDSWTAPDPATTPDAAPERLRVVDRQTLLAMIPANVEFGIRQYADVAVNDADPTYVARGIVGILLHRVDTAENINLDLPANVAGFQFLVTLGLMTQDLADTLVAGPLA